METDPGALPRPSECPAVNDSVRLPNCRDHDEIHRLQLAWHGLVLTVGLPLNVVAVWVFVRLLRLRTVVTVYLANLAACDLLFTLTLPLRIYYFATDLWPLGNGLCQAAGSLFQLNMYGSCLFLAAVNLDRYLALVHPLRSRPFRRRWVAWRACGAVWALILLGSIPMALAHDTSCCVGANGSLEVRCFESFSQRDWRTELLPLVVLAEVLGFLLPLSTVLFCSVRILRVLGAGPADGGADRRRRKVRLLLLANAWIFVLCFLPYNLLLASYAGLRAGRVLPPDSLARGQLRFALQIAMLLSSSNCCLDPLVYYFSTEGFRATFRAGALPPDASAGSGRGRWTLLLPSRRKRRRPAAGESEPGSPPAQGELEGELEGKAEECLSEGAVGWSNAPTHRPIGGGTLAVQADSPD